MPYLGMLGGIFNKLGKIGVIIGFALGNAILTYVANGNTVPVITIREILIASLGLLVLPKNINIDISDIVGRTKYLPTTGGQIEGDTEDTIYKLNTVSETISDIAKSYNEVAATTIETTTIATTTINTTTISTTTITTTTITTANTTTTIKTTTNAAIITAIKNAEKSK